MQSLQPEPSPYQHVLCDFSGVSSIKLRDVSLLTGLLIAGAGAAGFSSVAPPIVRKLPSETVSGVLLLDGCHIALHALPDRELLLLDVLAHANHDPGKVIDVFARRLAPSAIHGETHLRG
ncbi:MAG: S-adenosylmethionine decarboxylase [Gemmatimonadaceae bacterium]|nr:S-adenosylmethionine decarboxylase [Gemmatimonadaceae bacterium]MDQ3519270.1 S-adenosylmethionine decarboxylase [Gemmatimonadota bacterium]